MRELTYRQLVAAKACRNQLVCFRKQYGELVFVTVEAAREAAQLFDWDWDWAADNLLFYEAVRAYRDAVDLAWATYEATIAPFQASYQAAIASARTEYEATIAPVWAAYEAAITPWAVYKAADDSAWAVYTAARDSTWAAYKAATDPAEAKYKAAKAEAFALAYIADERNK